MSDVTIMKIVPGCYVDAEYEGRVIKAKVKAVHKKKDAEFLVCDTGTGMIRVSKDLCSLKSIVVGEKEYNRSGELVGE